MAGIKTYLSANNMVREPKAGSFLLEVYSVEALHKVYQHCTEYPLLGQKHIDFIIQRDLLASR
jgi:hypothetical protein